MALTIEDGSIVANADSYATVVQLRAFAAKRGATVPTPDADCEKILIKAMDYLATLEDSYKGVRVSATQALSWPREGVSINGFEFPANDIPQQLIDAQCSLAISAMTVDLLPTGTVGERGAVIRQKVGSIERAFAEPSSYRSTPALRAANPFLGPLLKGGGSSGSVPVVRT